MGDFLLALNSPKDAFRSGKTAVSAVIVLLTVLVNSVFAQLLQHFGGKFDYQLDVLKMLKLTGLGLVSYFVICAVLWLVCRCFGSRAQLKDHLGTWGMTFFPTLLCAIVVVFTETYFYVFWNSLFWGIVWSVVFGGILLWKTVLYIIYLREVAGLRGGRLIGAMAIICVLILALAWANAHLGLMTPVI